MDRRPNFSADSGKQSRTVRRAFFRLDDFYFKTHFVDDTDVLYHNDGTGFFDDWTLRSKLAVETRFASWGAGIFDLDNDGWPDIFFVTGSVYPEVEKLLPQNPNKSPRILFRNLGDGTFEELADLAQAFHSHIRVAAVPLAILTKMEMWTF